jgi:glycosyltransferase involved in cell wall biosynthesis
MTTQHATPPGLTVFIPVYNEAEILEENLLALMSHLDPLDLPYELMVGSNGSTDGTVQIGRDLARAHPRVTFFHVPMRGPGLAFSEALRRAGGRFFLCLDADLTVDLDFVPRALEALKDHDAVVGSKQAGRQQRSLIRIVGSGAFVLLTRCLLNMPFRDYSIGAKAYRTAAIRPFLSRIDRHTFYTQELLYQLQNAGKRMIEIPVNCHDVRRSKFNLLHEGVYRYFKLFQRWIRGLRP